MRFQSQSIFVKLVWAFVAVGIIIAVPLIYLSYKVNKESSALRMQQSVEQQVAIIADNFRQEFSISLLRSLKQIITSEALASYLAASQEERIITSKALESNLLRLQSDYDGYSGAYYVDGEGQIIVSVGDGERGTEPGFLLDPSVITSNDGARDRDPEKATRIHLEKLFSKIRTKPLLLSSGNMEWFMPPRQIVVEGPFLDEQGRLALLAGLPTIDFDNGGFGGVAIIRVRLDSFVKRLQNVTFYDESPIWLFATDGGKLLASPASNVAFNPTKYLSPGATRSLKILNVEEGLIAYQDLAVVADAPIIRIAYSIPSKLIAREYRPAIVFFLVILALASTAVLLLAYLMSKKLSTPIIQLAKAASMLARGELATRVELSSSGEVAVLVDSFNEMSQKLQIANDARAGAIAVLRNTAAQMQNDETVVLPRIAPAAPPRPKADSDFLEDDTQDLHAISELISKLITERKENFQSVEAAKEAADEANRAKGDFLATMSHEIRTPLNAVIGLSDILSGTQLTAEQRHLVKTMEAAGTQLLQIINDVLDFSRLQASRVELSDDAVELKTFVDRLMLMVNGLPGASRLNIQSHLADQVPARIRADDARLMQILTNLVGNAVKFTEKGSIDLRVSVETSNAGPQIRFDVSDTGSGIAAELRDQVFEPFKQGSAERLRPHAGSGLGLAICRRLAAAMDGKLELTSTGAQGSCFSLTLPLREAITEAGPDRSQDRPARAAGGQLRILVAEDTPANQLVIQLMLKGLGHSVRVCEDGAAAVQAFSEEAFDLVLLDIQMPIMDGYEAARRIRAFGPAGHTVPIVALTAFTQNSDKEKAQANGISAFLSKPIRSKDLQSLISNTSLKRLNAFSETPLAVGGSV